MTGMVGIMTKMTRVGSVAKIRERWIGAIIRSRI